MKKYWILSIILILACSTLSFAKTIKKFYSNGKLESVIEYNQKGQRNGKYALYRFDGILKEQGVYKNGKIQGTVKKFDYKGDPIGT